MLEVLSSVWVWVSANPLTAGLVIYGVVNAIVAGTPTKKDDEALDRIEQAALAFPSKVFGLLERLAFIRRGGRGLKLPGAK